MLCFLLGVVISAPRGTVVEINGTYNHVGLTYNHVELQECISFLINK